ncbi:MAG: leucine-rich repeat domain-containing protein, partial [Phycisphaerae bacterium]|nr:leucine-rich repeat domain-containing protein [Phycisphaerae bacterium]
MSTRHAVISAVAWITVFTASTAWAEAPVLFVDPKLKSAVEEALGVLDPTPADMGSWPVVTVESDEGLSFTGRGFACTFGGIEDLTGLEYARDMEVLNLDHNQIKDLTPLAGVTGLRVLILSDNNGIEDLGPLSGLGPQLFHVNLHRSGIQDVGPLSGLTGLRWLSLRVNSIEDVGPLGGLSGLESLILRENQIEDVGPLSGLTGLEELDLRLNPLNRDAYCHG